MPDVHPSSDGRLGTRLISNMDAQSIQVHLHVLRGPCMVCGVLRTPRSCCTHCSRGWHPRSSCPVPVPAEEEGAVQGCGVLCTPRSCCTHCSRGWHLRSSCPVPVPAEEEGRYKGVGSFVPLGAVVPTVVGTGIQGLLAPYPSPWRRRGRYKDVGFFVLQAVVPTEYGTSWHDYLCIYLIYNW